MVVTSGACQWLVSHTNDNTQHLRARCHGGIVPAQTGLACGARARHYPSTDLTLNE